MSQQFLLMPLQVALNLHHTPQYTLWNTKIHIHKKCALYSLWCILTMFCKVYFNVLCKFNATYGGMSKNYGSSKNYGDIGNTLPLYKYIELKFYYYFTI